MSFQNRGIVVGKVVDSRGKPVDDANVTVVRVQVGSNYTIPMRKIMVSSEDGEFACPFVWDDWETFTHDVSVIRILVAAYLDDKPKSMSSSTMIAKDVEEIRGYLQRDVTGFVTGALAADMNSIAGLGDAAAMALKALAGWNDIVPIWAARHLASSANWLIVGGVYMQLT